MTFKEIKTLPLLLIILLQICDKSLGDILPQSSSQAVASSKVISPKDQVMIIDHPIGFNIFAKNNNSKIVRLKRSNCRCKRCIKYCRNGFGNNCPKQQTISTNVSETGTMPRTRIIINTRTTRKPLSSTRTTRKPFVTTTTTPRTTPATMRSTTERFKSKRTDTLPKHIKITNNSTGWVLTVVKPSNKN
ncbi:uncharacterized protein LOC119614179 [Lucilia sericata]|uniref:uncharacterized protein LOC119614179 n=1 Tax=Lucilia sericata TaxID=13632 RepID=UPI0018A859BF|nr:uncharacterized protein LOC119614179 [Lucilia sericata]